MKNTKINILILIIVCFLPLTGLAKDKIIWLTKHWPPFMELDESRENIIGGQRGIQLKLLQASLTEYEHLNREMSWSRFWFLVKTGEKICNCMSLKSQEREKIAEFSIPISVALPNHIVMRKETMARLGSPESLSLISLMQDPRFKGLLITKRSYSQDIDTLLQQQEKGSNITRTIIDEQTSLKMLAKKRMDYILEYPFVITRTTQRDLQDLKDKFVNVPIMEIAPFYYVYVACPKNEWGKTVISKINNSLKKLRSAEAFRNALKESYSGQSLKVILEFYDTRLLGGNE